MAYHPENIEVPLGDIKIEHRKTDIGGIEHIAIITPEIVANAVSRMDYDSLGKLIQNLSANIDGEGERDSKRGRKDLANGLYCVANYLDMARDSLKRIWSNCQKYMIKVEGGYNDK